MRVFRGFHHPGIAQACALTIGNFDGVHRGHQAMLALLHNEARHRRLPSCVMTFEPHPRDHFARLAAKPELAPARIATLRDKLSELERCGVDQVVVLRFDARFASLSPQAFIDDVLVQGLGARYVLVGDDFRFGARRAGDFSTLQNKGFDVEAMPDVQFENSRVSSSAIRAALAGGDFALAQRLLGHPYTLSGRVAHGAKLGRELGFPTANIVLRHPSPLSGIYVVDAGERGPGVASFGKRPTVNPVEVPLLEVHLFGETRDLYGEHLKVRFLKKLRDERKFDGLPALRDAIARDAAQAKEYLATHG